MPVPKAPALSACFFSPHASIAMGDNVTRNHTPQDQLQTLLRTWTYITEILFFNGYSACLLKEFSRIASGQVDHALVNGLATSTTSSITETNRSEALRTSVLLSLITDHQTYGDASSLSLSHDGDRNVVAGGDDCQPANVYSKYMSRATVEDGADTVTDDAVEDEIDYSDLDDPSRVPPCLVSDSACLSQYHIRSPAQAFEDTMATEETRSQSSSRVSSYALAQISPLRGLSHRRESQSLPTSRSSMSYNTTSTDPPVIYTIPVSTAGLRNSSQDTDQNDDAPRSEPYHPRSCI